MATMPDNRQPGFYWVRYDQDWEIALWQVDIWLITGDSLRLPDSAFEEIDERPIEGNA